MPSDLRDPRALQRSLGTLPMLAQALAGIGLTLTAVINIPLIAATAGSGTWICYGVAGLAILLVSETLLVFRHHPAGAEGIAGLVGQGLGDRWGARAAWLLLLAYGSAAVCCLAVFGHYLDGLLRRLDLSLLPVLGFVAGALICLELARRGARLSGVLMLVTEAISTLIVLGLCAVVVIKGAGGHAVAIAPLTTPLPERVGSGLVIALLSFAGFESAATLGAEALDPDRSLPRALRGSVLIAVVLFLIWGSLLTQGLQQLPVALRQGTEALPALADHLGRPGAGVLIEIGAFLCTFGSSLALLSGLGRVGFALARQGVVPKGWAVVHHRFGTPGRAITVGALVAIGVGLMLARGGLTPYAIYDVCGGFSALAFLLAYLLVAIAGWRHGGDGRPTARVRILCGASAGVLIGILVSFLGGAMGSQGPMLTCFLGALAVGALLVRWRLPSPGA
ncbi:MAG: APC family permease [Synechococcaceae cyanobacterium ELA445]